VNLVRASTKHKHPTVVQRANRRSLIHASYQEILPTSSAAALFSPVIVALHLKRETRLFVDSIFLSQSGPHLNASPSPTMATRRIISQEKTLLEKDDTIGSSPAAHEKSNIAPAVPT
jgi:hypothetical protein